MTDGFKPVGYILDEMALVGCPVSTLPPDVVSAILRAPDTGPNALYPTRLGIFCDHDGTVLEADIIVNDLMSKPQRLEMIRTYARSLGWGCGDTMDLCPACIPELNDGGL